MASLPYLQFYVSDWRSDTSHLTLEQKGAYLELILLYWESEKALNNKDNRLAKVLKISPSKFSKLKIVLAEFFQIEGDIWTHGRIEYDLQKVLNKSKKASFAATEGARKRANERLANARRTPAIEIETKIEIETIDKKNSLSDLKIELKEAFELCELLSQLIVKNGGKEPNITKSWIQEMNRLMTIDERSVREIRYLIEWSQKDPFWCSNILSPKSLRSKFDQLRLKSPLSGHPNPQPKVEGSHSQSSNQFEASEATSVPPKFTIDDIKAPTKPFKSWRELAGESK